MKKPTRLTLVALIAVTILVVSSLTITAQVMLNDSESTSVNVTAGQEISNPNAVAGSETESSVESVLKSDTPLVSSALTGAAAAKLDSAYTLADMLTYAIQDEYFARAEYLAIMATFGEQRPFSNIAKAEETHISALLPLFATYDIQVPENIAANLVIIPKSLTESFSTGVTAEINNIAMYDAFLSQDLSEDVRIVFENLKRASESHLKAFQKNRSV